jgi:type II secretory pathway pseudopilin PulG
MNPHPSIKTSARRPAAFTLVEVLVIISVVALLSALLFPAFAAPKSNSKVFHCVNNLRQTTKAFILYAADNNDRIVPYANGGGFWSMPGTLSDSVTQARTIIQDCLRTNNPLYVYASRVTVFHCPSDERDDKPTLAAGWAYDSYSKTQNVGGESFNNYWGAGSTCTNLSAILSPENTFCFIEDADSRNLNLGAWTVQWNTSTRNFQWVDPPALFHGSAASVALTDGSVLTRQWQNPVLVNAGLAAARGRNPTLAGPLSGSDYEFVRNGYRFPGWQ